MKEHKPGSDGYEATIAEIKAQLETLQARKKELADGVTKAMSRLNGAQHNPITLQDYGDYIRRAITRKGDAFAKKWSERNNPASVGLAKPHNQVEWIKIDSGAVDVLAGALGNSVTGDELCFYFPDAIHARLTGALHQRYGDDWGNGDKAPAIARQEMAEEAEQERRELQALLDDIESKIRALNRAVRD